MQGALEVGQDPRFGAELVSPRQLDLGALPPGRGVARLADLGRARELADELYRPYAHCQVAIAETDARLKLNQVDTAALIGERELDRLLAQGFGDAWTTSVLIHDTVRARLELGRVRAADALVHRVTRLSRTTRTRARLEEARSRIDLAQGRLDASAARVAAILELNEHQGHEEQANLAEHRADLALWQGRPENALEIVVQTLDLLAGQDDTRSVARLLVLGVRACGDMESRAGTIPTADGRGRAQELIALSRLLRSGVAGPTPTTSAPDKSLPGPACKSWRSPGSTQPRPRAARPVSPHLDYRTLITPSGGLSRQQPQRP